MSACVTGSCGAWSGCGPTIRVASVFTRRSPQCWRRIARLPERALAQPPNRDTFLALFRETGIPLDGNRRTPEEIAEGLMRKMARQGEHPDVRRALAFLRRLVTLRGCTDAVLPQLDALIAGRGVAG